MRSSIASWPAVALVVTSFLSWTCACPEHLPYFDLASPEGNETAPNELEKRWFRIQNPPSLFWPGGQIVYCFDAASVPANVIYHLDDVIYEAWDLWVAAGVDTSLVNLIRGDATQCDPANRPSILQVELNPQGTFITSVGRKAATATEPGPRMSLDKQILDANPPYQDVYAVVAHEIGHVMGLLHEHQRPDLWDAAGPYVGGTGAQNFFGFDCRGLKDYSRWATTVTPQELYNACINYAAGFFRQGIFLATQFLPIPDGPGSVTYVSPGGGKEFDSESIMLYASGTFGAGQPPQTVMTYASGGLIPYNTVPSVRDVDGVNAMYRTARQNPGSMYWLPSSPYQGQFNNIVTGGGSCGS